jgi:hypothetical protein
MKDERKELKKGKQEGDSNKTGEVREHEGEDRQN